MDDADLQLNSTTLGEAVRQSLHHSFSSSKALIDRTLQQLQPADWLTCPDPEGNSIAVLLQHLIGNLRSRFVDFWTSDGEKPDRQRDQEFEAPTHLNSAALLTDWEAAWQILFDLLATLQPADLLRPVTIRGEAYSALGALQRQVAHYAYHAGQVAQLGRQLRGAAWQSLSIPRGQSEQFNEMMRRVARP